MQAPRIMAGGSLDSEPIEREELEGNSVRYNNIKLLDRGVWTDSGSETPTLYDETTFENTVADFEESEHDGPPVNIAHDLDSNGEPNDASIGGHIDPESIRTDGDALFGDIVLDLDDPAGAFADENLKSALESGGEVGFSPSVELTPEEMGEAEMMRAEEHVKSALLTGLGLVREPASKSVDFAHETRNRAVAMSANSQDSLVLERTDSSMDEEKLATLREQYNLSEGVDEGTIKELLEAGAIALEEDDEEEESEGEEEDEDVENEEGDDEEEEEEEETEMQAEDVMAEVEDLRGRVNEIESMLEEAADQSELEEAKSELEDATEELKQELADAETVEEIDKRLSSLEDEPEDPKTFSDDKDTSDSMSWANSETSFETNSSL